MEEMHGEGCLEEEQRWFERGGRKKLSSSSLEAR